MLGRVDDNSSRNSVGDNRGRIGICVFELEFSINFQLKYLSSRRKIYQLI